MAEENKDKSQKKLSWLSVLCSVGSAFFGVQTAKKLSADFSQASAWPYICIALLLLLAFIIILVLIVKLILFLA